MISPRLIAPRRRSPFRAPAIRSTCRRWSDADMRITRKQFCNLTALTAAGAVHQPLRALTLAHADGPEDQGPQRREPLPSGITKQVVQFVTSTRLDAMPAEVVGQGRRCLIDGFGVILAGMVTPGSAIVREYIKSVAGTGE